MVLRLSGNDHLRLERAAGAQRYRVGGNGLVVVSREGARAELCVTRRSAA